jgi:hypothetical protein
MTDHPITPPTELVQQWFLGAKAMPVDQWVTDVATQAAQWGADQELEACCEWFASKGYTAGPASLRAARRPKPPSLKEQALQALSEAVKMADDFPPEGICSGQADIIRRALEQLDD